jgi:hypothetical protein
MHEEENKKALANRGAMADLVQNIIAQNNSCARILVLHYE